jgi:hypothetical protein
MCPSNFLGLWDCLADCVFPAIVARQRAVCVLCPPLIFSFSMRPFSYQRNVGDSFFTEIIILQRNALFLIGVVGGWVQLSPLGTAATNRPIVPAPGDYDDAETGRIMIGKGNGSTRRKPAPVPLCPPQIPHADRMRTRVAPLLVLPSLSKFL